MSATLNLGTDGNWATKKDTILAYNDENSNFKPLPFSFDRDTLATRVNKEGLIETVGSGEPRIDYKDDSKGALLLEPSRSNSLLQSNQFDTTWATSTGISISSGYSGVYGSNDAWLLKRVDGSSRYLYQNVSLSNTQTFSIYLKADTTNWAWLFLGGTTSWAYFDLENGAVGATNSLLSSKIEPVSDGWFRCSITANVTLSSVRVYPAQSNLAVSGDSNLGIYIQLAQLEVGSYATSYIPTQGSAVTRVADSCNNENLNVDYSGDYTLYLEHEALSITEYNQFQFRQETSISYIFRVGNSINIGSGLYTTVNTIGFNKFALSVTSNGLYNFYKNGVLLSSGSGLNANLETLRSDTTGMNIKEIKLYNTALSNSELQALTQV